MATIINTPGSGNDQNGAAGWVVAIIALIILVLLALYFFPGLRGAPATGTTTTVQVQPGATGDTQPAGQPTTNNVYNTTLNASTTVNNSTTTTR